MLFSAKISKQAPPCSCLSEEIGVISGEGHSVQPPWLSNPYNRAPPQHRQQNPGSNLIFLCTRLWGSNHFTFASVIDFLAFEGKERMSERSLQRGVGWGRGGGDVRRCAMPDLRTVTMKTEITPEEQHLAGLRGLEWPSRRLASNELFFFFLENLISATLVLHHFPVIYWESQVFCS